MTLGNMAMEPIVNNTEPWRKNVAAQKAVVDWNSQFRSSDRSARVLTPASSWRVALGTEWLSPKTSLMRVYSFIAAGADVPRASRPIDLFLDGGLLECLGAVD